ncbi:MAG: response regulator, partial [Clostridiales bacterium]|nr:response regulator [Clostridiales bacterium]
VAIRACPHPLAKTIPIIAMTANAFEDDVKQALDAGMDAHIAKPVDMGKLKVIISNLRKNAKRK